MGDHKKKHLKQADGGAKQLPLEESRIIIRPDGEVVIENLSATLADAVEAMDPETLEVSCRLNRSQASVETEE